MNQRDFVNRIMGFMTAIVLIAILAFVFTHIGGKTVSVEYVNLPSARAFSLQVPTIQSENAVWATNTPFKMTYIFPDKSHAIYQTPDNQLVETTNKQVIDLVNRNEYFVINEGAYRGPHGLMKLTEHDIDFTKADYYAVGP